MEQFTKISELIRSESNRQIGMAMVEQIEDPFMVVLLILANDVCEWTFEAAPVSVVLMRDLILDSKLIMKSEFVDNVGFKMCWEAWNANGLHDIPSIMGSLMALDKNQIKILKKL
jgi:hypothetical protein